MEHLTDKEVCIIICYLQRCGIYDVSLLNELTDHLAVLTEMEMEKTSNFFEAFKIVSAGYEGSRLKNMQQEVALNYYYPKCVTKKVIYLIGLFFFLMLCLGLYLRHEVLPFRKVVQIVGAIGFGYFFIPVNYLHKLLADSNKVKTIAEFVIAITLFHGLFAFVVKWPFAKFLVPISILLMIVYAISFEETPLFKKQKSL